MPRFNVVDRLASKPGDAGKRSGLDRGFQIGQRRDAVVRVKSIAAVFVPTP